MRFLYSQKKLILFLSFIFLLLEGCISQNGNKFSMEGYWGDSDAIGSGGVNFYTIQNDHKYFYSIGDEQDNYIGTYGEWKIDKTKILFKPLLDIYYDKNDKKEYGKKSSYDNWLEIGDIDSKKINPKYLPQDIQQPMVLLKYFTNGNISKDTIYFYRFYNSDEMSTKYRINIDKYKNIEIR